MSHHACASAKGCARRRLACGLMGALVLVGCGGEAAWEARDPQASTQRAEPARVGAFALGQATLYRTRDDTLEALAVLPGGGAAPDTLEECAPAIPELRPVRFEALRLSPDPRWAAWSTTGPGSCVGVAGPGELPVRVLAHWPAATPDSLIWAPASRYLAVWLAHAGGRSSLSVFDVEKAERLEMPWELECEVSGDCDVVEVEWFGGTLLDVEIRLGPAESSVPFEVNVGSVRSAEPKEETL